MDGDIVPEQPVPPAGETTLQSKVAFLSRAEAYPAGSGPVTPRETHMSWVFLTSDRVYKLKKPVRFPYLDFSTLKQREAACRAELRLNRRLAGDVYQSVTPLVLGPGGFAIGGPGDAVDWLVVMRRLSDDDMLETLIARRSLEQQHVDRLAMRLARFYRTAMPARTTPNLHMKRHRKGLEADRQLLLDRRLGLPAGPIRRVENVLRAFIRRRGNRLAARARHLVDGHGDLRPEHIWFGDGVKIIDCLEFNATLRAVDPFDEIAYLDLECERLGAPKVGTRLQRHIAQALHDGPGNDLYFYYRCRRAFLRARLAIAHLMEPAPRQPEKWPRLARAYLSLAVADARRLDRELKRPAGR